MEKSQEGMNKDSSLENLFTKSTREMTPEEYTEFLGWVAFDWPQKMDSIELRDTTVEIKDFENRIASFEATYSLEELFSINDLAPEDAPNHPVREPARKALIPIVAQLNILKIHQSRGKISTSKMNDLIENKYMYLSRAVGIINKGKVDHTR